MGPDKIAMPPQLLKDRHVVPLDDLKEHQIVRDCWCNPRLVLTDIGRTLVIHYSLDGRELVEQHGVN